MTITRDVIMDLLPLYVANEVSADTRVLVDKYLETNPELARLAKDTAAAELPGEIPAPLTKEDRMEAYEKAQRAISTRMYVRSALIAFGMFCAMGAMAMIFLVFAR